MVEDVPVEVVVLVSVLVPEVELLVEVTVLTVVGLVELVPPPGVVKVKGVVGMIGGLGPLLHAVAKPKSAARTKTQEIRASFFMIPLRRAPIKNFAADLF